MCEWFCIVLYSNDLTMDGLHEIALTQKTRCVHDHHHLLHRLHLHLLLLLLPTDRHRHTLLRVETSEVPTSLASVRVNIQMVSTLYKLVSNLSFLKDSTRPSSVV